MLMSIISLFILLGQIVVSTSFLALLTGKNLLQRVVPNNNNNNNNKNHDAGDKHTWALKSTQCQWSTTILPTDYEGVEALAQESLLESISNNSPNEASAQYKLLSIDVLTPGLNPKLEQKAMLMQEYVFSLTASLLPALKSQFANTILMFPSAGDAAGFNKYCRQTRIVVPGTMLVCALETRSLQQVLESLAGTGYVESILIVNAKNNLGDPVINEVESVYNLFKSQRVTATTATTSRSDDDIAAGSTAVRSMILLNCDLSERVATSMRERTLRDRFRAQIQPCFYFRNLVFMTRPTLVPIEVGAIMYQSTKRTWELFGVCDDDIDGSGSLNRFTKLAVFARSLNDPTALSPPRAVLAGTFPVPPNRDDIENLLSRAKAKAAKASSDSDRLTANGFPPITTFEQAVHEVGTFLRNPANLVRLGQSLTILAAHKRTESKKTTAHKNVYQMGTADLDEKMTASVSTEEFSIAVAMLSADSLWRRVWRGRVGLPADYSRSTITSSSTPSVDVSEESLPPFASEFWGFEGRQVNVDLLMGPIRLSRSSQDYRIDHSRQLLRLEGQQRTLAWEVILYCHRTM